MIIRGPEVKGSLSPVSSLTSQRLSDWGNQGSTVEVLSLEAPYEQVRAC